MESVVGHFIPSFLELYNPRWLHVMKEQGKEWDGQGDEYSGRVKSITGEMHTSITALSEQLASDRKMVVEEQGKVMKELMALCERSNKLEQTQIAMNRDMKMMVDLIHGLTDQ